LPQIPSTPAGGNSGFAYNSGALQGATLIGPAKVVSISVDLIPRLQNPAGLLAYAKAANTPGSGEYRQFLTASEIGDRFGAGGADYKTAVQYFQSQGLSVATWPQRLLLHVTGAQKDVEAALHTTFGWYRSGTSVFLAPMTPPAPPASAHVAGAADIVMRSAAFTDHVLVSESAGNGIIYGYSPQQIAAAFDYTGAYNAGYTGTGITTGVIGTAGIDARDVPAYKALFGIGGSGTVTMISATDANAPGNTALGFASPPPVTAPCPGSPYEPTPACNPEDGETQLDTEQLASLAPNANLRYYLAYNPNDGCGVVGVDCPPGAGMPLQGLYEFNAELETAIADDTADVLSLSFGGPEAAMVGSEFNSSGGGITPLELAALASEGVAVFVSSGDSGAQGCINWPSAPNPDALCVSYPSTDPNVVSVGGVNTPLNTAGQLIGGITGWGNRTSGGNSGSGGGVSAYFSMPPFQLGAAGVTGATRNVPDISLDADALTGVAVELYADPSLATAPLVEPVGGTSVAAPESAAMWALVLQACKQTPSCETSGGPVPYRLGNPNAYFYKLYANAPQYASVFYDVVYGNNSLSGGTGYSAGTGYDLISGIGVPYARALIKAVVGK
ncbi:MAG TPA: protease pro-enzyme activation domain-containing protein, partial [Candidatus Baltobacteraceae bacterium]|nr:protease pro-enzyme activation domain-containing protein [Candidatus Baltobacteraceae bacterium]